MASFESVEKKIREANFFLNEMRKQESLAFGDSERFDFYLSGFLNAARTIDNRLRHDHKPEYPPWRDSWDALNPQHQSLLLFMAKDRAADFHKSGSDRSMEFVDKPIHGIYSDRSGTLEVFGAFLPGPSARLSVRHYSYEIDGTEHPVLQACEAYLKLLTLIADEFRESVNH